MTSRSTKNVFPSFSLRSGVADLSPSSCRFCPDWATTAEASGAPGTNGATNAATLDDDEAREAEEFSDALERYRLVHRRRIVSFEEAIAVFKSLGYRKNARPSRKTDAKNGDARN